MTVGFSHPSGTSSLVQGTHLLYPSHPECVLHGSPSPVDVGGLAGGMPALSAHLDGSRDNRLCLDERSGWSRLSLHPPHCSPQGGIVPGERLAGSCFACGSWDSRGAALQEFLQGKKSALQPQGCA